jgi:hypothetical protein
VDGAKRGFKAFGRLLKLLNKHVMGISELNFGFTYLWVIFCVIFVCSFSPKMTRRSLSLLVSQW